MSALPLSSSLEALPRRRTLRRWWDRLADALAQQPRRVWLLAAVLLLFSAAVAAQLIVVERRDELAAVEARAQLVAVMAKAHIERIFDLADASLQGLDRVPANKMLTVDADPEDLNRRLAALIGPGRLFADILVADAQGRVTHLGRDNGELPTDISHHPYFRQHRAERSAELVISAPVRGRPNRPVTLPVSRRLETSNGIFAGVVMARLRAEALLDLYGSMPATSVLVHL